MAALEVARSSSSRPWRAFLAAALLAGCPGGGNDGPRVSGTGFAPAQGPGDVDGYFPQAIGDAWLLDYNTAANGLPEARGRLTATVAGPRTIRGVSAIAISQVDSGGLTLEDYYAVSPGGITYLGNDDPTDDITPWLVPYPQLLFPVALGDLATIVATGLPAGRDPYGNPLKLDVTQRIANEAFEPVAVPAGAFPGALKQVTTIGGTVVDAALSISIPFSGSETRWFAPGVGLVKQATAATVDADSSTGVAEVRGYSVGGVPHGIGHPATVLTGLFPGTGNPPVGNPVVGSDGDGFLVVGRRITGSSDAYLSTWVAQRVDPGGAPLGGSTDLEAPGAVFDPSGGQNAAVSFDGANYLVVYEKDEAFVRTGHTSSLTAVRVSMQGAVVGGAATVAAASDALPGASDPALGFDGARYLLVLVRHTASGLYQITGAFVSPSTGQADGGEFAISADPGYPTSPALAFDGENYLVVWSQSAWLTQPHGVVAARVTPAGAVLDAGGIPLCTSASGGRPAVAWDGARYLVVWSDSRQHYQTHNIHGVRVSPAGDLLDGDAASGGFPITTGAGADEVLPALAFFDGNYLAAWLSSSSPGVYEGLYGARISPGGAVLSPGDSGMLLTESGFQANPMLAAASGSALLTWLAPPPSAPGGVGAVAIHPFAR